MLNIVKLFSRLSQFFVCVANQQSSVDKVSKNENLKTNYRFPKSSTAVFSTYYARSYGKLLINCMQMHGPAIQQ